MHCDPHHTMIPLERYNSIISALNAESETPLVGFWLRFAAQASILCPDSPEVLAGRIRRLGIALHKHTHWYKSLATPARFVVAAMLVQHNISVHDFLAEHGRLGAMWREVGLRPAGLAETMAVLIVRIWPEHRAQSMLEAERLKAIYDEMKKSHWWLTGRGDLPACAALAQCSGPAEMVAARAEYAYQELHAAGLASGSHLHTAANLLPLIGLDMDVAVLRYRALKDRIVERLGNLDEDCYDAVVILTMLNHEPLRILDRLLAIRSELDLIQNDEEGSTNFIIAADLTFLDMVRMGHDQDLLHDVRAKEAMLRDIHIFHIVSAVLVSRITPITITTPPGSGSGMGWP